MPIYIFLDTNNWIYLTNGFNVASNKFEELHFKLFDLIEKRTDDNNLVFLINDIVLEEFNRNKEETEQSIKNIINKTKNLTDTLRTVEELIPEDSAQLSEMANKIREKAKQKIQRQRDHILNVEHFLRTKTTAIPVEDSHHIEASKMAVAKKAPFVGDKKNSQADALLLLSALDYLYKNHQITVFDDLTYYPESYFVSSNFGDFSDPTDRKKIHPDLSPILQRADTKFFWNLYPLIKSLDQDLLSDEEAEALNNAVTCEICEYKYSNVVFSISDPIFDPHSGQGRKFLNQHRLFNRPSESEIDLSVRLEIGECENCGSNFIKCPNCQILVHVIKKNTKLTCPGCHYCFIAHEELDQKGIPVFLEYEIVQVFTCSLCGKTAASLNESGHCEECEEYERIAQDT